MAWLLAATMVAICWMWPRLVARARFPLHLFKGDSRWVDGLLAGLFWALYLVKLVAVPALVWTAHASGWSVLQLTPLLFALVVISRGLTLVERRGPTAVSSGLRSDAVFLWTVVSLAALTSQLTGADTARLVVAGVTMAMGLAATAIMAITTAWGRSGRGVWIRTSTFRVLGDNPDASTALVRLRVGEERLTLTVPPLGRGPHTIAAYDLRLRCVSKLQWSAMRSRWQLGKPMHVTLGPPGSDLHLAPGRYLLSVRAYQPLPGPRTPPQVHL